jgi:hypothetical protein
MTVEVSSDVLPGLLIAVDGNARGVTWVLASYNPGRGKE